MTLKRLPGMRNTHSWEWTMTGSTFDNQVKNQGKFNGTGNPSGVTITPDYRAHNIFFFFFEIVGNAKTGDTIMSISTAGVQRTEFDITLGAGITGTFDTGFVPGISSGSAERINYVFDTTNAGAGNQGSITWGCEVSPIGF